MKENTKKSPELRFKGFTDDWEQRKLKLFLKESKIHGSNGFEAKKLTIKLWGKGIVPKETIYEGSTNTNYFIRKSGQLMYGKLDFLNAAFGILPSELDGYESTIDAPSFDINLNADPRFLLEKFLQKSFYHYEGILANGSRRAKRINQEDFLEMAIQAPSKNEQSQIGNFFQILDKTIALHKRKLEQLKLLKQAYLQVMFPTKNAEIPRLRFANFTNNWGTHKLGEVLNAHSFKSFITVPSDTGEFMVIQQGDNPIAGFSTGTPFKEFRNVVLFGDHTLSLYKPRSPFFVATDGIKILSSDDFGGDFLFAFLKRFSPITQGYKRHFMILKNQIGSFPLNSDEREKIGKILNLIDSSIKFQNQKISSLQKTKQAYLQKMFI